MAIRPARAWGFALVATTFAVASVESGFFLRIDDALPLWDKPVHALCAFGLVLTLSAGLDRRRLCLVAVTVGAVAWELAQFFVDPLQGHTPEAYALDTFTDLVADILGALFGLRALRPLPR